jgi:toxin FitB
VIILDTNIIAEMMRPTPDMKVLVRLEQFAFETVYTTSITIQELYFGATKVRATERYQPLMQRILDLHKVKFAGRILNYDAAAAELGGRLQAKQKMRGEVIDYGNMQIAAIAIYKGCILATRNTKDFEHTEVKIFNPWEGN